MGSATWQAGKAMKSCSPCYAWDPKTWSMAQISHSSIVIFRSDGCIIRAGRKLLAKQCIENIGGVEHMYTWISFANLLAPHKPISSLCQRQIQKTPGLLDRHAVTVELWRCEQHFAAHALPDDEMQRGPKPGCSRLLIIRTVSSWQDFHHAHSKEIWFPTLKLLPYSWVLWGHPKTVCPSSALCTVMDLLVGSNVHQRWEWSPEDPNQQQLSKMRYF